MNKMISKLLVSLAVVCGFGMNAQAGELAKSGEFSGLGFYDGKVFFIYTAIRKILIFKCIIFFLNHYK